MFIYRLVTPLDDFDDLVALPDWLRGASPASIAWVLQAVLALQDSAEQVGWRGDMRHLPSVAIPSGSTNDGPVSLSNRTTTAPPSSSAAPRCPGPMH